jgi:hypothetical protein
MKNINIKVIVSVLLALPIFATAQVTRVGNNGGFNTDYVGLDNTQAFPLQIRHRGNQPIDIYTRDTVRARFTTNKTFSSGGTGGDGLRFLDLSGGVGNLDLWTSSSQQTHIRWDGSGLIQGRNNRFEMCGFLNGLWFNTQAGRYIFNRDSTEVGRVGTNNQWRFGLNAGAVDPARRVEIFDNAQAQLRLTQTNALAFTDFLTNNTGNLVIDPTGGRVGIGLGGGNPTHNLHVAGNGRFTNLTTTASPNSLIVGVNVTGANDVELRRLAFTGNTTDVLLGNGTWGTTASLANANNGLIVNTGVVQLGQATCAATGAGQLIRNSFIPMNNFNLVFADAGASQTWSANRIGVGVCTPAAKVDILRPQIGPNEALPLGLKVTNTDIALPSAFNGTSASIHSICNGTNRENRGAYIEATAGRSNIGVMANGYGYTGTAGNNYGGQFGATDNYANYGVTGFATNPTASSVPRQNIGVLGYADGAQTSNYGVCGSTTGTAPINYAGYFNGDVHSTGTVTWVSDKKFKNNISDIDGTTALSLIAQLSPKTYQYNNAAFPGMTFSSGNQIGLIAQEVEIIIPELVKEIVSPEITDASGKLISTSETYKSVNYVGLIPLLVGSVKQQQSIIDSLAQVIDTRIAALEASLLQCCNAGGASAKVVEGTTEINRLSVELSAKNVVILEQNVPNPFAEQTTIDFYLPDNVGKAQMLFYNAQGMLIKAMDIAERGNSRLTVFASDLSSGVYTYTLVTDGNVAETKRMIKSK